MRSVFKSAGLCAFLFPAFIVAGTQASREGQTDGLGELLARYAAARHEIFQSQMNGMGVPDNLASIVGRTGVEIDSLLQVRIAQAVARKYEIVPKRPGHFEFDFEHIYQRAQCQRCLDVTYVANEFPVFGSLSDCQLTIHLYGEPRRDYVTHAGELGNTCFAEKPTEAGGQPNVMQGGSHRQTSSVSHTPFNSIGALRTLYDAESFESSKVMWRHPPRPPADFSFFDSAKDAVVHVIAVVPFENAGDELLFLVTGATPDSPYSGCHACTEVVGVAKYELRGFQWQLDAFNPYSARGASWGKDPGISLIQTGAGHSGLKITSSEESQGFGSEDAQIVIERDGWIGRAFEGKTEMDGCDISNPRACWSNKTTIEFLPVAGSQFFELSLTVRGTEVAKEGGTIVPVLRHSEYVLSGRSYVPIATAKRN